MPPTQASTCEYVIDGNPDGPTLLFIHGWPDDASLWRKQVEALAPDYRCVRVTLPNFGRQTVRAGGFNFSELQALLLRTLEEVQLEGRLTLVTHDWGAYLGYLLEQSRPDRIERMIALDIGGHIAPGSFRERFFIVAYQWTLIALWLLGGVAPPLGDALTRRLARMLGVPARQAATARSRNNYPYFYLWRGLLLPWWGKGLLQRYRPRCPVLYLWGRKKPVMFHSSRWLEIVEASGGACHGVDGAGHWFLETHPDEVNRIITAWLSTPGSVRS
jgi:pimeloyl-ACP methyl ester carboxylesterase